MTLGVPRRRRFILPLTIALLGLGINIIVAATMAPTTDEKWHTRYGLAILEGRPGKARILFDSKMPVSAFNSIPIRIGLYHGLPQKLTGILLDVRTARWATVAAAFGLSLLVFLYAESLFGRTAGLFAQLLFVMEPNLIAHSTLSTTDLYAAATALLFLYRLRRFMLSPGTKNALWAAVTLSVAQLTKFTSAYLYLVLAIALISSALYTRYGQDKRYRIPGKQIAMLLALTVVSFFVIINAGFLFDKPFTNLTQYNFYSQSFRKLQQIPVLRSAPLPFPRAFIQGLDGMSYHNATGSDFGNMVLLNDVRGPELPRSDGFAGYYLTAYLMKEPIGMQILLLVSLIWVFRKRRMGDLIVGEGPLLVTAGVFLFILSLFSSSQVGIRHILPVLAIFMVLSGGAFAAWAEFSMRRKLLLTGCVLYAAISVGSYFPDMIPYFNEILTDRRLAYRYLADSNLDWGQDTWVVDRFLKNNPDVILEPEQRVAGRILVRGDLLAGVWPRKADYFLRVEGLKPVAQVGYGHFLFVIPAQTHEGGAKD